MFIVVEMSVVSAMTSVQETRSAGGSSMAIAQTQEKTQNVLVEFVCKKIKGIAVVVVVGVGGRSGCCWQ